MPNYLEAQQAGQGRERGVKNFLKAITNMGEIMGNETRLKSQLLANQLEKKQNFLYKLQEQEMERKNKLNFIQEIQSKMQQGGQDNMGNINAPQIEVTGGGEPSLKYPSARDKEFIIKQAWGRIDQKQASNMPLNDIEKKFVEKYPRETWVKEGVENQPFAINKGIEIPQGYETVGYDSKGNPMVRKIGGKVESYTEQKRSDIQSSVEKIRNGQSNFQAERKNLLTKYPDIGWDTLQNLNDIEKMYKPEIIKANRQFRDTAIQELKKAGYPVTESNINNAIEQLRGQ